MPVFSHLLLSANHMAVFPIVEVCIQLSEKHIILITVDKKTRLMGLSWLLWTLRVQ